MKIFALMANGRVAILMRLIDADTLVDTLNIEDNSLYFKFLLEYFKCLLEKAPTIDAVSVIHAHPIFEHKRNNARCSNCGNYTIEYDMDNWDKYCSHCGAKMDGKDGK